MSCKSAIYVVNTTSTAINENGVYTPNTIIRRFGQNVALAGNGVTISGSGYYKVTATATLEASATTPIVISIYKDGAPITGATATISPNVANDVVTLPLTALVRLTCNCQPADLTVVVSGQAVTGLNLALVVEKE